MPACHVTVPGRLGGQVLCMLLITKAMDPPPPTSWTKPLLPVTHRQITGCLMKAFNDFPTSGPPLSTKALLAATRMAGINLTVVRDVNKYFQEGSLQDRASISNCFDFICYKETNQNNWTKNLEIYSLGPFKNFNISIPMRYIAFRNKLKHHTIFKHWRTMVSGFLKFFIFNAWNENC